MRLLKLAYNVLFRMLYGVLQRVFRGDLEFDGVSLRFTDDSVFNPRLYFTSKLLADEAPGGCGLALDYGCGSGYTSVKLALKGWFVVAVDLNEKACESAWATATASGVGDRVCIVRCDGASAFRRGVFNLVASNPPYMWGLVRSYMDAGVVDEGARFLKKLVVESKYTLGRDGLLIIIYSSISPYAEALPRMLCKAGFEYRVSRRVSAGFEEIIVYKASKRDRGVVRAPQPSS